MFIQKEAVLCLSCHATVKGRTDKKFCNDYCRNDYNNALRSPVNNMMRNINNALGKNRRILHSFLVNGAETCKLQRDKLIGSGFMFRYFTHTYTSKKGSTYFFCYDTGYLQIDPETVLIVKKNGEN